MYHIKRNTQFTNSYIKFYIKGESFFPPSVDLFAQHERDVILNIVLNIRCITYIMSLKFVSMVKKISFLRIICISSVGHINR